MVGGSKQTSSTLNALFSVVARSGACGTYTFLAPGLLTSSLQIQSAIRAKHGRRFVL